MTFRLEHATIEIEFRRKTEQYKVKDQTYQKVLGHSDITVTFNIYVHNDMEVLRKQLKTDKK